ncbi:MAG TPA: response regulator [Opitutaceae bacterium]|nr:response regulator [Opitutaceae bacterium]
MEFSGKVLIVDDEAHIRKYLSLIVKRLGTPVILEAQNGEEALLLYETHTPDIVLLDVNMPGMDGIQALERLRQAHPKAVVVMLTSLAARNVVERCVELGAVNFLRKDTPKEAIAKIIGETIQAHVGK